MTLELRPQDVRSLDAGAPVWFGNSMVLPQAYAPALTGPVNMWKLAVAPQRGVVYDASNELMRLYSQQIPGSAESGKFLMSLVHTCKQQVRELLLSPQDREVCSIEFVSGMCRGLEVAYSRVTDARKLIMSPYEHPASTATARWFAGLVGADVTELHFEPADYFRPWPYQVDKLADLVTREVRRSDGSSVLTLSTVSFATGVRLPIDAIQSTLCVEGNDLQVVLDGAHAAVNAPPPNTVQNSAAYVMSAHKWMLAPEPCGIIVTPRPILPHEVPYDAWSERNPATTVNVRVFTGLLSSLRALQRGGAARRAEASRRLRERFLRRVRPLFVVVGESSALELTGLIAICPRKPYRWRFDAQGLGQFLESQGVYALVLTIDPEQPWLRIAFAPTLQLHEVDSVSEVLALTVEGGR